MTLYSNIIHQRFSVLSLILLVAYGGAGWYFLHDYFGHHPVLLVGLLLMPCVGVVRKPGQYGNFYGLSSVLLLALSLWMPVKTLYFLALGCAGLFWIEGRMGRVNHLPLFLLGVLSPVFNFFSTVFGFPIRLRLSGTEPFCNGPAWKWRCRAM